MTKTKTRGKAAKATDAAKDATAKAGVHTEATIESLVFQLADKLGVKPVELNAALRPLVNPAAATPAAAGTPDAAAAAAAAAEEKKSDEPGILDVFGEALLD